MGENKPGGRLEFRIPEASALELADLVSYQEKAIVSRILAQGTSGSLTLFAFDANEALSEHTSPFEALSYILEGEAEFTIGGQHLRLHEGQLVRLPANVPHALKALSRFKTLLIMLKA